MGKDYFYVEQWTLSNFAILMTMKTLIVWLNKKLESIWKRTFFQTQENWSRAREQAKTKFTTIKTLASWKVVAFSFRSIFSAV